jgi:hypothetical protein
MLVEPLACAPPQKAPFPTEAELNVSHSTLRDGRDEGVWYGTDGGGHHESHSHVRHYISSPHAEFMAGAEEVLTAAARISVQAAEHGDLRGIDRLLAQLAEHPGPEARAWTLALETALWVFQPQRRAPALEAARELADGCSPQLAAVLSSACAGMERVAFCTFDAPLLGDWIDLHQRLEPDPRRRTPGRLALDAALLWQRLLHGNLDGLDGDAKALGEEASRLGAAAGVIETEVLRALAALSTGALEEALELGRRASRMAQAEALSHHEYLANITLARIRRYSGRPHLALHILGALGRVAPGWWSGWIGWETLLAGGAFAAAEAYRTPSARAKEGVREFLDTARRGDRTSFDRAAEELLRSARIWSVLGEEAAALVAAVDPSRDNSPEGVAGWRSGSTAAIPFGLHGIGVRGSAEPQSDSPAAYVLAGPGQPGRRFLFPGLPLVSEARMLSRDSSRTAARTETGIAALALAGETGDSRDGFFRSVYGFPFVPYRHRAVLDTLCHRMRTLVGAAGEIRRNEAEAGSAAVAAEEKAAHPQTVPTISLVLRETIIVPDMRCVLPTADRVLRALAVLGPSSANAAAECLRMPLRTVQAVLQQLVAEGACITERDGRRVAYRIEDTTFTEVTTP